MLLTTITWVWQRKCCKKFDISRQDQDEFALNSQKTEIAVDKNKFNNELIKINQNGNILDKDEHPRSGLELTDLKKLRQYLKKMELLHLETLQE